MSVATGDLWRVRIAPGEEKVLTLEQVDDLYRLEMIDENTMLWQEGMDEWLPLKVVAGLDEEEAEPSTLQVPPPAAQLAPPPAAQLAPPPAAQLPRPPAPPPPPASLPPPPKSLRPPEAAPVHRDTLMPGWTAAPAVRSEPPPPPSARRAPTPPPPPVQSAPPPAVQSAPPPAPAPSAAPPMRSAPPPPPRPSAPPLGSAPPPISNAPPRNLDAPSMPHFAPVAVPRLAPPTGGSRAESVLIGFAVVLGLVVTLHRNGVLHALAGNSYASVEAALGGPGFGTPGAVEALVKKTPPQK